MPRFSVTLVAMFVVGIGSVAGQDVYDGKIFDAGYTMTTPSEMAPAPTKDAMFLRGIWNVVENRYAADTISVSLNGIAEVTLFNRGHGFFERRSLIPYDESDRSSSITLYTYNPTLKYWQMGIADGDAEQIQVLTGKPSSDAITVYDGGRPAGSGPVVIERQTVRHNQGGGFTTIVEYSLDLGDSWKKAAERTYSVREEGGGPPIRTDFGVASANRPENADGFDFLIGEWNANHDLTFPNGQQVKYPANASAVFVLDGKAIMEFNSVDVDTSFPDAATTIIRLYNRAEKRWESLYSTNRSNGMLYFGGAREGEDIVLHEFDNNRLRTVSRWVFHDIQDQNYSWYGASSQDGGETFRKTWIITFDLVTR